MLPDFYPRSPLFAADFNSVGLLLFTNAFMTKRQQHSGSHFARR